MPTNRPYTLVHEPLSHETIAAAEQVLQAARDGHVVGSSSGEKRRRYIVDAAGGAYVRRSLGVTLALDDAEDLVHRGLLGNHAGDHEKVPGACAPP
jgi:hypothetical protein